MTYLVRERQSEKVTRLYEITGPRLNTVVGFWDFLVAEGIIEGYSITEREG